MRKLAALFCASFFCAAESEACAPAVAVVQQPFVQPFAAPIVQFQAAPFVQAVQFQVAVPFVRSAAVIQETRIRRGLFGRVRRIRTLTAPLGFRR